MALTTAYLTGVKNLEAILEAIRNAQAPEKFTSRFMVELGFESINDRLMVGVLKGLGFLEESGEPTERYFTFLDSTQSERVLAEAIREAYGDLFRVNSKAYELDQTEVKQKLKTLTRGTKGDAVLNKMSTTFLALCKLANFKAIPTPQKAKQPEKKHEEKKEEPQKGQENKAEITKEQPPEKKMFDLAYNIHIQLPATRDQSVYDAIFRSLKEHIL
jgi:cell division GTPase FtsZ